MSEYANQIVKTEMGYNEGCSGDRNEGSLLIFLHVA